MDSTKLCLKVEQLYRDLTQSSRVKVRLVGLTLKVFIVADLFKSMSFDQRREFLFKAFEKSEYFGKYLVSFEPYTPTEADDSGFGDSGFDSDQDPTSDGNDKAAAKEVEL